MKSFGEGPRQQQGLQLQLFGKTEGVKAEENQGLLRSQLPGDMKRGAAGDLHHSRLLHLLDAER